MKRYLKILLCGCWVIYCLGNIYANPDSGYAKNILEEALQLQKSRTFTAIQNDDKFNIVISRRLNNDGTTYYRRETISTNSKLKNPSIELRNEYGTFSISSIAGRFALKYDYHQVDPWEWYYIYDRYAIDTMSQTTYHGIRCYLIQKKILFKDGYYSIYRRFAQNNFTSLPTWCNRATFKAAFPSVMEFYVGEKDKFIYARKVFNPTGRLLGEINFRDVVINPVIKDSVFKLPSQVTIQPVSSRKNCIEVLSHNTKQAASEYAKSRLKIAPKPNRGNESNVLSECFWNHCNLLSCLLAGLAILILVAVAIVKGKR